MNVVYKYRLMPGSPSVVTMVVTMPRLAKVIHVGSQYDGPVLWALVDTSQPDEERSFWVYGTGHPITEADPWIGMTHHGTVQTESGLVWHIFEKPIERNIVDLIMGTKP